MSSRFVSGIRYRVLSLKDEVLFYAQSRLEIKELLELNELTVDEVIIERKITFTEIVDWETWESLEK